MTSKIIYSTSLSNHNIAHMLKVFTTNHMGTHHGHFRPHPVLPRGNLKTEVSLWKCIKCFPSTPCWRNLEAQKKTYMPFSLEWAISLSSDTAGIRRPIIRGPMRVILGGIWKRRFHSESASNFFRPHYAEGIKKRNNHRPFYICICVKLRQGNIMIIV